MQMQTLSYDVLGKDLPEQDFAKRMVDMVNQRKKHFAEERAKAKRNKPMTQSQLRIYMSNYLKNQGLGSFSPTNAKFEKDMEKELQLKISKKQREDLIELYRLVMQKYGTNRPEDAYDRVLWSDLRTMFDPPLNEDAIWSLPLQQKMVVIDNGLGRVLLRRRIRSSDVVLVIVVTGITFIFGDASPAVEIFILSWLVKGDRVYILSDGEFGFLHYQYFLRGSVGREFLEKPEHFSHSTVDFLAFLEDGVLKSFHSFGVRSHLKKSLVGCFHDALRCSDSLVDEFLCVIPAFMVIEGEVLNDFPRFVGKWEGDHVTLTPVIDTQKTGDPTQSSSISSDFTNKLLNLDNPSLADNEITSLMVTTAQHETTIPEITSKTTTSLPTLPDFASIFKFNERVFNLEKDVSEIKQVDKYAQALSFIPAIVDRYMDNKLGEAINKAILAHNLDCR
ncbi:hypothetical protein Tco_0377581 [Tanacetum coccineum]